MAAETRITELEIQPVKSAGLVRLAPDVSLPRRIKVRARTDAPLELEGEVAFSDADGRMTLTQLTFRQLPGGPPITGESLRIPLRGLISLVVVRTIEVTLDTEPSPLARGLEMYLLRDQQVERPPADWDKIKLAAALYRLAWIAGFRPTRAVVATLGVPRSTASRWIAEARERGYLGPTEPRKAGERRKEG
jgi:hypothetical protein